MSSPKLFLHGVPDTPAIWTPLFDALDASDPARAPRHAPALPGFEAPPPAGFPATKEAYTDWLIGELETLHHAHGKVDIVGHDWGATLTLRAACLRPDLIRSWTISNAAIDETYQGHVIARLWNTPLIGEMMMAVTPAGQLEKGFIDAGVPAAIAAKEAAAWRAKHMRQCILKLYRSSNGLRFKGPWVDDLEKLPPKGLLIWGDADPYMPVDVGQRFANRWGAQFVRLPEAQHWAIAEQPEATAEVLTNFWRSGDA